MRRIIGREGIAVDITDNTESQKHSKRITLGVGGIETSKNSNDASRKEEREAYRRDQELYTKIDQLARETVLKEHPDFSKTFIPHATMSPSHEDELYFAARDKVLSAHPELVAEQEAVNKAIRAARERRYAFAERFRDNEEIKVGKEGTLIYSLESGEEVATELEYEMHASEKLADWSRKNPGAGAQVRVNWREIENQQDSESLRKLVARMKISGKIADINQIEVLPAFRGKGVSTALFDVAQWDINDARGVKFTIARILEDNPQKNQVLHMFENNGFLKIYCPGEDNTMTAGIPNYYLMIKEN